jgi:hypothetical protein
MNMKTITLACARCAAAVEAVLPVGELRAKSRRTLCRACRYKGFWGFFWTPLNLILELIARILNGVAYVIERVRRRR